MSDSLMADGSFQGLKAIVDSGYTNMGINYGCGCQLSRWYKDGRIAFEYSERCNDHREASKAGDPSGYGGAPQIGQEHHEPGTVEGTSSADSK